MLFFLFLQLAHAKWRIGLTNYPPYNTCQLGDEQKENFTGYYPDILRDIAKELNWENDFWSLVCIQDTQLQTQLLDGNIDAAVGLVQSSSLILQNVIFSTPIYDSGLVLVVKSKSYSIFWIFLQPFDYTLWLVLIVTAIFQAHIHWMLERQQDGAIPFEYSEGILESFAHTFASFFRIGDKRISTVPGRLVQVSFWIMGFILLCSYTADLTTRLSVQLRYTDIKDYTDIDGKQVGTYSAYAKPVQSFGAEVVTYSDTLNDGTQMINALLDGDVDAIAIEHPVAYYQAAHECDIQVVGDVFVNIYQSLAFKPGTTWAQIQDINYANTRITERFRQRNLRNKHVLQTDQDSCSSIVKTPVEVNVVGGLWILLVIMVFLSVPAYAMYRKYRTPREEDDEELLFEEYGGFDNKQAAEIDLISKYDKVLKSSQGKFSQKLKDLESVVKMHTENSNNFEESLKNLRATLNSNKS